MLARYAVITAMTFGDLLRAVGLRRNKQPATPNGAPGYLRDVPGGVARHFEQHLEPEKRPHDLERYVGMWVAVKDGRVVAVAETSRHLVYELHKLGDRGKGAVAQLVQPAAQQRDGRNGVTAARFQQFPYREEDQFLPENEPPIQLLRPTVDVTLFREHYEYSVRALIDTGAPFTLFDSGTAEALGLDPKRMDGRPLWHSIVGGRHRAIHIHVALQLHPFTGVEWDAEVGFFVEDIGLPFAGILGHFGFLDRWVVTFNAYDNYFVVEERDSFVERLPPDHEAEYERRDLGWQRLNAMAGAAD